MREPERKQRRSASSLTKSALQRVGPAADATAKLCFADACERVVTPCLVSPAAKLQRPSRGWTVTQPPLLALIAPLKIAAPHLKAHRWRLDSIVLARHRTDEAGG